MWRENKKIWSKLQKELYQLRAPELLKRFQVHCEVYRMKSQWGSTDLPRYWISLDGSIIWDFPKDFVDEDGKFPDFDKTVFYPYGDEIRQVSDMMRLYLQTSVKDIDTLDDRLGLFAILKAADRRVGKKTLEKMLQSQPFDPVQRIAEARLDTEQHM